jgi:HAD superfamily hydrolase (TIGR01509 family)
VRPARSPVKGPDPVDRARAADGDSILRDYAHVEWSTGPRLRALLVDVGGTLVRDETWLPEDRFNRLLVERLAAALGEKPPWAAELVAYPFSLEEPPGYEHRMVDEIASFLRDHGAEGSQEMAARICRACALPLSEVVEIEPDARAAMEAAHGLGLKLGVVTNTGWRDDDDVRRDWSDLGFGDLFDAYVSSKSVGVGKPHPRIFQVALERLGEDPEAAAMVGDQLGRDVAGGKAAGLRTIWKRPRGFEGEVDPAPDATITRLAALTTVLQQWI